MQTIKSKCLHNILGEYMADILSVKKVNTHGYYWLRGAVAKAGWKEADLFKVSLETLPDTSMRIILERVH